MMDFVSAAVALFVGLFVLTHPFGNFAIFLGLTANQSLEEQKRTAMKTSVASLVIALVSLFFGSSVLAFFGLTIPALQVAGGLIFLTMGMKMVGGEEGGEENTEKDMDSLETKGDPSVVPLALPMIMGPGVIVGMISFANNSLGEGLTAGHLGAIVGTVLAVIVVWLVLRASPWLATKMSPASIQLITQLTGIIVLGIGVLMGSAGLVEIFPGWGG
jgi:multiple antibiotic resistance protein